MPYKNIVFVKLLVELLNDYRWTHQCNSNQKLLYLGLLLIAGATNNKIPNDPKWIKWRLNLKLPLEMIEQDVIHLSTIFDKVLINKDVISFSNFDKIHSFIQKEKIGVPITAIDKRREDKDKIRVREEKEKEKERISQSPLPIDKLTTETTKKLRKVV